VSHWAGRLDAFQPAVNRENLDYTDDDGKTSLAVALFQNDYLLVRRFVNNYT